VLNINHEKGRPNDEYCVITLARCCKVYQHLTIDGHVCWHSKRRLPIIGRQLRKINFRFPFEENKQ
jgi:hypothetical protein